jgi:penicillin amidase
MLEMFRKFPLISRVILFFILPLVLVFILIYKNLFMDTLPVVEGSRIVEGIEAEILIERDENGVVYLTGSHDKDIYFSMGYIHAQDRMWQLEVQKRISQGRLSEIFGKGTISKDIWIRTLGIYQSAKAALPYLSKEALASLDAYSAGVNHWIKERNSLPIEFTLFGIEPELWTNADSLAWIKIFALNLAGNYSEEIKKFIGTMHLTETQMKTFYPGSTSDMKLAALASSESKIIYKLNELHKLQYDFENDLKIGGRNVGSNAWVVSGKHTESGAPILANDPHLGLQLPSLWYPVSQKGNTVSASGMSLIGIPLVIFGKNNDIAWGGTSMMADVQDLYVEQLNPLNPTEYKYNGQWLNFETRTEKINVKADFPSFLREPVNPIEIRVRKSKHGPIISDVIKGLKQPISLSWTALEEGDTTYEAFYKVSLSTNWTEFKEALTFQVAPALNFLYADKENNIGMIGAGKIPIRSKDNGGMPVFSGDKSLDWQGFIPPEELPQYFNPDNGYLINANNSIAIKDYKYLISKKFATEERATRIEQLIKNELDKGEKITLNYMKKMQGDVKDLSTLKLLKRLKQFNPTVEQHKIAIDILKNWEGSADELSVGATIFYGWARHIKKRIFIDELKVSWNNNEHAEYLTSMIGRVTNNQLDDILRDNSIWCDDIKTRKREECDNIVESALFNFIKEMTKLSGSDIKNWKWGSVQTAVYSHTPFSEQKILKNLFERRVSSGGGMNTINVASSYFNETEGFLKTFGAGFRQIIELDKRKNVHIFMNSTGQSGVYASPYYDNMIEKFRKVEFTSLSKVDRPIKTLTLKPIK